MSDRVLMRRSNVVTWKPPQVAPLNKKIQTFAFCRRTICELWQFLIVTIFNQQKLFKI